ncbi:MAG TPA: hypothetical protein VG758_29945 [Hyphomicrobiaceae bacterium]|nr:hypothetical protein [Hyphomicrobiaceae bacterium]
MPVINRNNVKEQLANLTSSGDYASIIGGVLPARLATAEDLFHRAAPGLWFSAQGDLGRASRHLLTSGLY